MLRWRVWLVALVLLLALGWPALAGSKGGGRVIFGEDFTLAAGQELDGDLLAFGGVVTLEPGSAVRGNVLAFGGAVRAAGRVDGNVMAFGGRAELRGGAVVGGDVLALGGIGREPGAVVRGQVAGGPSGGLWLRGARKANANWPSGLEPLVDLFLWGLQTAVSLVLLVALGLLVVSLAPGPVRIVSDTVVLYPGASIGVGLLAALAAALAVPLLVFTCIGIPVALLAGLALAVALAFGWIAAGLALGERVLLAFQQRERQPLLAVVAGLVLLAVLASLDCLGGLVAALVAAWGLGAVVLTRCGTARYDGAAPLATPRRPAAPTDPPEPLGESDLGQGI